MGLSKQMTHCCSTNPCPICQPGRYYVEHIEATYNPVNYYGVNYIEELKERIAKLEARIAELE